VCQFIVENILEELDQPGEWCLDSEEGVLYFWPLEDSEHSIDNMEVVAPVVKCLIHLREVSDVHISGFVFTETKGGEPSSHYSDVEGVGAMRPQMGWEYCGEAIYLNMCKNCYIEDNKIFNVGGNGIYLRNHNERNVIRGNEISYAGANGVVLAGSKHNILKEMMHTTSGTPHPVYNEITDNIIHHIGVYDTYVAGVFLGLSSWNRFVHNEIHDVPHHAINLGNSRYGRNYIEYNRICRACQVTDDTGAINCWNEMPPGVEPPGHVIRYNFISDTGKAGQVTMGIYLDNWCSQCIVQGNIIVNTAPDAGGFAIFAKGRNNIIENNILINSNKAHIIFAAHYPEMATVFSKNIVGYTYHYEGPFFQLYPFKKRDYVKKGDYYEHLWEFLLYSDYNLFFGPHTKNPMMIDGVPLSDWPKKYGREGDGYDTHSIVADPMFVDPEHDDYRLRPESPALKLGFQSIDVSKIGIRNK
jgi:parallel beta-helix repeat protein